MRCCRERSMDRRHFRFGLCLIAVCMIALSPFSNDLLASDRVPSKKDSYDLMIMIQDPYNPRLEIHRRIKVGKRFKLVRHNGRTKTTISGKLYPVEAAKFPLAFWMREWYSKTNNLEGSKKLHLEIGKPFAFGEISGIVYMRTLTLKPR
jgi:hypothetical protein